MNIKYILLSILIAWTGTPILGSSDSDSHASTHAIGLLEEYSDEQGLYHTAISMEKSSDMQDLAHAAIVWEDLSAEIPHEENHPHVVQNITNPINTQIKEIAIPMGDLSDSQDSSSNRLTIHNLPVEILHEIVTLLDPKSLIYLTRTNRFFEKITRYERVNLLLRLLYDDERVNLLLHLRNVMQNIEHENIEDGRRNIQWTIQWTLEYAAQNNLPWAIDDLVRRGADVNAPDYLGKTPLILAAEHEHDKVVTALLNNGANYFSNCRTIWNMHYQIFHRKHPKLLNIVIPTCCVCLNVLIMSVSAILASSSSTNHINHTNHTNSTML